MHLTQMPRALASGMAQTGRGRPHRGQSTGARSAPEAGRKGFVAVLQGDNATASFPQSSGQREAFLQLGTPLPLFALKLREVSSPESDDLHQLGLLGQVRHEGLEPPPVEPCPGEVDAVSLLERGHDGGAVGDVVQRQLDLLRLRKTHPAFHSDAEITTTWSAPVLSICWKHGADMIVLRADLVKDKFEIQ